jgi:hypothetical protein
VTGNRMISQRVNRAPLTLPGHVNITMHCQELHIYFRIRPELDSLMGLEAMATTV